MEYLRREGIRWFPMNMEISWDSKQKRQRKMPSYVGGKGGYMPKTNDFEGLTNEELKERQEKLKECTHIAIETQEVKQIDFDTDEHKELMEAMKKKMPYFLSSTKKLPHCFVKTETPLGKRELTKHENVEILAGLWSFCEKNAEVQNADAEIPEKELESMLPSVYREQNQEHRSVQIDYETLEKVVQGLSENRCNEYDDWLQVVFAILKTGEDNGYAEKTEALVHTWSKQHPVKYDKVYLNKLIEHHFKAERSPGYGTLCYYLKQDDEKLFKKLSKENKTVELGKKYEEVKEEFEKHTFKVLNPPAYVSHIEGSDEYNVYTGHNLKEKYLHMVYETDKTFITKWVRDPRIKLYSKMDFLPPPKVCGPLVFNGYTGFEVETMECETSGNIEPILKHIENLCNHEDASVQYFTKWLAHLIQQPGELTGTTVVLKSDQGTGKNTLTYLMRDIIGHKYYKEVTSTEELFGRFSVARKNKLLVNIDEMNISFKQKNAVKNMVTSKLQSQETKGLMPIELNNFCRFILTTNNDIPLPIEVGDRRVVVFTPDNSIKGNREYFKKLQDCCNKRESQKAFYEYLRGIDISEVDWENDRPLTEEYRDIQSVQVPIEASFLHDLVAKCEYLTDEEEESEPKQCMRIMMGSLYVKYKDYMIANGYEKCTKTKKGLGTYLKKCDGVSKGHTRIGEVYELNCEELLQHLRTKYHNL